MCIHIINTITASGYIPGTNTHEDSRDVVLLQSRTKQQCTRNSHTHPGNHTNTGTDNTLSAPVEPYKTGPLAPLPSPATPHTHHKGATSEGLNTDAWGNAR